VLKKVALVAATSAAAAVSLAPVAFAHEASSTGIDKSGKGLINVSGNDVNVPIQACNNDVPINGGVLAGQANVKDIVGAATGALGVFGKAKADTAISTDTDRSCGQISGAGDSL
jgi:opacity protein-like surface antigen